MSCRRLVLWVLLLCAAAPGAAPGAAFAQDAGSGGVLVVGDSLEVLTSPHLHRYLRDVPLTINVKGGYSSPALYRLFREAYDPSQSVIVFDAGTNDNPAYPQILASRLASVARAVGDRCMVVPTIHGLKNYPSARKNQVVAQFAASRPGTQTPDWESIATGHPELMQPDDLHPNIRGADVRARLIARAVRACLGEAASLGPPLQQSPGSTPTPAPRPRPRPHRRPPRRVRPPRSERPKAPPPKLDDASPVLLDEPVAFTSGGATLKGELITPGAPGRHPAVVMLQDSGRAAREDYREQAEYLAEHGVAALIYDRPAGHSYSQLAADGRAAVALLARRPEVNPDGIGVWGLGEGGSIAPLVAAGNEQVRAVMAVSPAAVAEATRRDWAVRRELDASGAGSGDGAVSTWYSVAADAGGAGSNLSFMPAPAWRNVAQPVLAVWGGEDRNVPVHASAVALAAALDGGANADRTFRTFAGADHALGVRAEGFRAGSAPGFKELSADWFSDHLGFRKPKPVVSTPLPPPDAVPVRAVASPSALERWPVQLAWLLLPALALAVVTLRELRRRRRGAAGELQSGGRTWWWAGGVVALDLLTLGALAYAVAHIVETGGAGVSAVAGMPLPIAVTWVLAGVSIAATVLLARQALAARGGGGPRGPAAAVSLASAAWLLLAIYWLV
jgi:uncharacterized protein